MKSIVITLLAVMMISGCSVMEKVDSELTVNALILIRDYEDVKEHAFDLTYTEDERAELERHFDTFDGALDLLQSRVQGVLDSGLTIDEVLHMGEVSFYLEQVINAFSGAAVLIRDAKMRTADVNEDAWIEIERYGGRFNLIVHEIENARESKNGVRIAKVLNAVNHVIRMLVSIKSL